MAGLPPPYSEVDAPRGESARTLPSEASSSLSQDSTFVVTKEGGKAEEQLARSQEAIQKNQSQTAEGYLDKSGNFKTISPAHNFNVNQFYASVESPSKEQIEQMLSDSWGPSAPRTASMSTRLDIIEEASPSAEVSTVCVTCIFNNMED